MSAEPPNQTVYSEQMASARALRTRREFVRTGVAAGAGLTVLSPLLAACGSSSTSTGSTSSVKAATAGQKIGGTLNFINVPDANYPGEFQDFEDEFGVKVNEISGDYSSGAGPVATKVIRNPEEFDLALLDLARTAQVGAAGHLVSQTEATVPNLKLIPESIRKQAAGGVPFDAGKVGITYRKDLIQRVPKSWADFWELAPQNSGKVVFLDDERSALGAVLRFLGYSANTRKASEIDAAKNKVLEIRDDILAFRVFPPTTGALSSGAANLAMSYDYEVLLADDPRIGWAFPEEGSSGFIDDAAVIDGGNVKQAVTFANWLLEPKNYAQYINSAKLAPIVADALPMIDKSVKDNPALSYDPAILAKVEFAADVGEAIALYTRAWEEVRAG